MPRPSLSAALSRLAELRDERKRRSRDRFKVVARDFEDRAATIRQVDQWRAEVDKEIRATKAVVARLMAKRAQRRAANPRPPATRGQPAGRRMARAG